MDRLLYVAMTGAKQLMQAQSLVAHNLANVSTTGFRGDLARFQAAPVEGPGGRYYNIPTVWGGQILTLPEATQRAAQAGWQHWPSYPTPDAADLAYERGVHSVINNQDLRERLRFPARDTRDLFNPYMPNPFSPR